MEYASPQTDEKKSRYTVEEYFAMEETAEYKSEYVDGKMEMMAGASEAHEVICFNLIAHLHTGLRGKGCQGYPGNMKVWVSAANRAYYPDAMAVCGKTVFKDGKRYALQNPIIIFEVLSPTTEQNDRGEKFQAYQKLPSFREYVLISQDQFSVEVFFKQDEQSWLYRRFTEEEEQIPLQSIDASVRLGDLYENVSFREEEDQLNKQESSK